MGDESMSNWQQLMEISESDKQIVSLLEDCRLNNKEEIIYFVSENYPLLPSMTKNKPYSQIIGSIMPRIASRYRRDENYRRRLDAFLQMISRDLDEKDYPAARINNLLHWINTHAETNNTTA